ncbi:MAG: beta-lactamase family protein [Melioribacteraceae bacterium]|nr:beta-lactamase family protein [Melioribacteraceae bacterium]
MIICKFIKRVFILILVFTSFVTAQIAEPSDSALIKLDKWINNYLNINNVPGGLAAVASKGKIVHVKPYGMANVELSVPVSDSTVFEIGSISKQFVVAAVLLLKEDGKLKLEDSIHDYLPFLPGEWLGVTVKHLMNHTSGIPDYEEIRTYDVYRFRLTPEDVIKIAHSRPMDFKPGTGYYYSNTAFYLLSMIVERIEGKPLGQILESRIFAPLNMHQTRMANPEDIIPKRASGYWENKTGELINRFPTETSSTLGAGGLLSSVYDMAKWDEALYSDKILNEKSKQEMWTSTVLPNGVNTNYGFGWSVRSYMGLKAQSHSGQVAGFVANFARFPEEEICVIVFMNRYRVNSHKLKYAVLHTFIPGLGSIPD